MPLKNPKRVLDIGTGTGAWAMDFADRWPTTEVLGTDISAIQPSYIPPNCRFEIHDVESDWTFPKNHFDLIHIRYLVGSIGDWDALMKKAFDHLAPGGYLEIGEQKVRMFSNVEGGVTPAMSQYFDVFDDACKAAGKDVLSVDKFADKLKKAGFDDVEEKIYRIPVARWPKDPKLKEIGLFAALAHTDGFEAYGLGLYTAFKGWEPEKAKAFFKALKADLAKKHQLFTYRYNYVARKPLEKC